jgi:hypothetical protein
MHPSRSGNSSITIITSAIITRWAMRSSTASITGRPDDAFAVARGSVDSSITTNGPRDRTGSVVEHYGHNVNKLPSRRAPPASPGNDRGEASSNERQRGRFRHS